MSNELVTAHSSRMCVYVCVRAHATLTSVIDLIPQVAQFVEGGGGVAHTVLTDLHPADTEVPPHALISIPLHFLRGPPTGRGL